MVINPRPEQGGEPFDLPGVGRPRGAHARRVLLRDAIAAATAGTQPVVVPGVTDALGARLVDRAGFQVVYASGAGIANAQFGVPDVGLISISESVDQVGKITNATDLPVIVDADTGYGGPLNAMRTVRLLERAGAAAIQVEDQEMPKRCGHFDQHRLIPLEHMQSKITAMLAAREDDDLALVARTDGRSAEGIDAAIKRADAYARAGADMIFVEAPRTIEELERVGAELAGIPLVINVVEGGKTPELQVAEYKALGFSVVIFANYLMRSMIRAGRDALRHLREHGETRSRVGQLVTWDERQELFNLPAFGAAEAFYDRPWGEG